MSNIVLKMTKRPAGDACETPHRVPYVPRQVTRDGNMQGNKDAQLIAADHRQGR